MRDRLLLTLALALAACGPRGALDYGRQLFNDPSISTAGSNAFRCSTCHETVAPPTRVLPGFTLHDVAVRPTWWGNSVLDLLDATNQCVTQFMRGRALSPDDDKSRSLLVYLESLSTDPSAPGLPLTTVKNITDVPSGDAGNGNKLYHQACGVCHGEPHTGQGRISSDASAIPDDTVSMFGTDPTKGARPIVIEKVRHGKFFSIGGIMPPFSLEALSDAQLGDILAYLEGFGLPKSPPPPSM